MPCWCRRIFRKPGETVEYSKLEIYAKTMLSLARGEHEFGPRRLKAEQDRNIYAIYKLLRGTINRLVMGKNMGMNIRGLSEEVEQHSLIAIHQALETWDPSIATFSTHVYWQIRAELATLQHHLFPERRKIKVKQPIRFLEFDRPIVSDKGDSITLLETLSCETSEEDVEISGRDHFALHTLERVFSHYIAREMTRFCSSSSDLGKAADRRKALMRNRDVCLRRYLGIKTYSEIADRRFHSNTYDEIAVDYGVTRERIRQIIRETEEALDGQLPRYCRDSKAIIEAERAAPREIHPSWPSLATEHYSLTGVDPRLVGREVPLASAVEPFEFAPLPSVIVETSKTRKKAARLPVELGTPPSFEELERLSAAPAPRHQMALFDDISAPSPLAGVPVLATSNDAPRPVVGGKTIKRLAFGLAAASIALPVAAQTSRAIPPAVAIASAAPVANVGSAATAPRKVAHTAPRRSREAEASGPLQPMSKIVTNRVAFGVRLAEYSSADEARNGWSAQRRSWTWLRGLYPGYIAPSSSAASHGVAFGPLDHDQAVGMCHEARRLNKACQVVSFGVARGQAAYAMGAAGHKGGA